MVAITDKVTIEARFEGQNLHQGTAQAIKDMKRFEDSIDKVGKENKQLRGELNRVQKELKGTGTAAKKAGKEMEAMDGAQRLLKRGMAALAVYMSVGKLKAYGEEWTNLRNRVKLFTKDQEETERVIQALFVTSNKTRQSVSDTAEVYQRFAMANKSLNLSQNDLQKLLLTINQSVALSGVSGQAASAALVQLGQGMAAGVLRGEELNSVIEQTPRLAMAIAEGMGKTTGDLKRLGEEGKITAQAVVNSIFKEAKRVDTEFQKLTPTIDQSLVVLNNSFGQFIDKLEQQYGIFEKLANKIGDLGLAMGADDGGAAFKDFVVSGVTQAASLTGDAIMAVGTGAFDSLMGYSAKVTEHAMRNISNIAGEFDADLGRTMNNMTTEFVWGSQAPSGVDAIAGRITKPDAVAPSSGPDLFNVKPNTQLKHGDMISRLQKRTQGDARFGEFMAGGGDHTGGGLSAAMQDKLKEMDLAFGEHLQDEQDARDKANAKGIAIETDLLNKQLEAAANTEMEKLKLAQRQERLSYEVRDANRSQLDTLDKLHKADQQHLKDLQEEEKQKEKMELVNQGLDELSTVLSQNLNPAIGESIDLIRAISSGDTASMISFATSALDHFFAVMDSGRQLAEAVARTNADQLERQRQDATTRARIIEGVTGRGHREELLQPIIDQFKDLEGLYGDAGMAFEATLNTFKGTSLGQLADTVDNFQSLSGLTAMFDQSFLDQFESIGQLTNYMAQLSATFGPSSSMIDVVAGIVEFDDGLSELQRSVRDTGRAAKMTAEELAPLTRSIRMGFDVEEMAMRKRAQGRMQMAGADPYLQNRVLKGLSRSIDNLRSRESASLRAARTGGSAKVTVGSGSGSGGSSSPTSPTTGVDGTGALVPEVRLNEIVLDDWADAVDVSNATPIERNWNDIVPLIGSGTGHKRINPEYWYKVVETHKGLERNKINRNWNDVIPLLGQAHKRINPEYWYNVVEMYEGLQENTIDRNWNDVIPLLNQAHKRINPQAWVNVIEVEDLNKNLIGRNWDQVVSMGDKINVGWGDIFNLDGNGQPHGTIDLDVGAAVRLVGERAKINIGDLIDMGALDGIITKSVNRAIRDRSVTVSQSAANSTSGTNTSGSKPSNAQESNFRGPIASTVKKERLGWN